MSGVMIWLGVAALGGAGAVARLGVGEWVTRRASRVFPWGTFVVNVLGAGLLGALVGHGFSHRTMVLIAGAFLGAFTTFSTWMLETHRLVEARRAAVAGAYVVASVAVGMVAFLAGRALGGG